MIKQDKPAACDAAGSAGDAFSWQATRSRYVLNRAPARPHLAEMRVRYAGHSYIIRYDASDPNWRARALVAFNPLDEAAFAVRAAPLTIAERVAFASWSEAETLRILRGDE
jgi:hypothetical protein